MSDAILIALIFSLGFGIQSVFGFAGNTLSLAILIFFFDGKDMIVLKLFVSIATSLFIFLSGYKSYSHKVLKEILIFAIWLGHRVHLQLSEKNFQTGVALLLLVAGISFLV